MNYNEFKWNENGLAMIYNAGQSARNDFDAAFATTHRDFLSNTVNTILSYKKGFLQKERTIVEFLIEQTPKAQRTGFAQALSQQMGRLNLTQFKDRKPKAMGSATIYRWAVLADVLWGKRKFIVRDDGSENSHIAAKQIVRWLLSIDPKMSVVWLSGCSEETLLEDPMNLRYCIDFWRVEQGGLTVVHTAELHERKNAIEAERLARLEAEITPKMERARVLKNDKKYSEALAIYDSLCEQGWKPAMVEAAKLYFYTVDHTFSTSGWERGESLCERADTVESILMLGDFKDFQANYAMRDSTANTSAEKRYIGNCLTKAIKCYENAAGRNSVEGCYKAASLLLQYTNDPSYTLPYSENDAITYIKQLLAYKHEEGYEKFTALDHYLYSLKKLNERIYMCAQDAVKTK